MPGCKASRDNLPSFVSRFSMPLRSPTRGWSICKDWLNCAAQFSQSLQMLQPRVGDLSGIENRLTKLGKLSLEALQPGIGDLRPAQVETTPKISHPLEVLQTGV